MRHALWLRQLPVLLLGVMLIIGLGLEAAFYDGFQGLSKVPLAILILLVLLRRPRS